MTKRTSWETVDALRGRYDDLVHPFPNEDYRKVVAGQEERYLNFKPDLGTYFYSIASHCNGARKMLDWPCERLMESRAWLSLSFFERWPQYRPLEPLITETAAPTLYADIRLHESARQELLACIGELLAVQERVPIAA